MPKYTIQSPSGGKPIIINAEAALSDDEIDQIVAEQSPATPKPEALSSLEQMLGGKLIDPVTGQRSVEQIQGALEGARARGALAQADVNRQQLAQELGVPGAIAAGAASVPQGLGELITLAAVRSGMANENEMARLFPEQQLMGETINQATAASPVGAAIGSAIANAATMGRAGGVGIDLARSGGAALRGNQALASELLKKSLLEGSVGAGANVAVGEGTRLLTGGETTPEAVTLDLLLGALTAGKRLDPEDLNALIRQRVQPSTVVVENVPGLNELVNIPEPSAPGILGRTVESVKNLGSRTQINLAEAAAQRESIRSLARDAAERIPGLNQSIVIKAAENGILPRDIQIIVTSDAPAIKSLAKMQKQAKAYSENRMSDDPALIIGDGFISKIKNLEQIETKRGQELGNIVKDLNTKNIGDAKEAVVQRLQSVRDLSGIKIGEDGKLDFSDTTLSGSQTAGERKALQAIFDDIEGRTPLQIHNQRRELFQVLGGKKKAGVEMTDTLDKGIQAVRQGLADVLDQASPEYRQLNQAYAQTAQPLQDISRYFRGVEGAGEDILKQKGALLGRRLTSNMQSSPELRDIVKNIDQQIINSGGKVDTDLVRLQEFYNALSRYYDLAKDTSLAGQVKLGTGEIPTTLRGTALKKAKELSGQTQAVQRKYLEDLINALQ